MCQWVDQFLALHDSKALKFIVSVIIYQIYPIRVPPQLLMDLFITFQVDALFIACTCSIKTSKMVLFPLITQISHL